MVEMADDDNSIYRIHSCNSNGGKILTASMIANFKKPETICKGYKFVLESNFFKVLFTVSL